MEKRKLMGFLNSTKFESESTCDTKTSSTYLQEKERFVKDVLQFHTQRGSLLSRIPRLCGKPLDLYTLYLNVTRNGGWERVTNDDKWFDIMSSLNLNKSCGNADFALRHIYIKYLHHYEKIHYFGQEGEVKEEPGDPEDGARKKNTNCVAGVAFSYNQQQHNISDSTREALGVSRDPNLAYNACYASLEKSLASGLPNEVDFAINICLLISNDSKQVLKGSKSIKIVELLLSHVGIAKQGPSAHVWDFERDTDLNFFDFWNDTVECKEAKGLVSPDCFMSGEGADTSGMTEHCCQVEAICNSNRQMGMKDKEAQRVTQVAHIIRNFLVDEENAENLSCNMVLFRFLMLCVHNRNGSIRQLGLDSLSFLSTRIVLDPVDCKTTRLMLRTISKCVRSTDKFEVLRGCDLIGQLSQSNEDNLCIEIDESLYSVLIRLLTLHDLQLLVASLEALYQLSESGHVPCNTIASTHKSIDILLDLLTMDAQKQLLTPDKLDGSSQPPLILSPTVSHVQSSSAPTQPSVEVAIAPPSQPGVPSTSGAPSNSCSVVSSAPATHSTPSSFILSTNLIATVATSGTKTQDQQIATKPLETAAAPQNNAMIANFSENERTAFNWITTQYEFVSGSETGVSKMEMFRRYISECSVHGLQKVVSPTPFENCIKAAFPQSRIVCKDNSTDFSFVGIAKKNTIVPKQNASVQYFPAIEQALHQKSTSTDERLLDGIDKDLVSVAADAGIEIVSNLPLKSTSDATAPSNGAAQDSSLPPTLLPGNQPNSSQSLLVNSQQLFHQQLVLQKIITTLQSQVNAAPSSATPASPTQQAATQQLAAKQLPLNANIIGSVLAQQRFLAPAAVSSTGLSALQAQLLLKQVMESQRLSTPFPEQKSLIAASLPSGTDLKKRKAASQSSPLPNPTKKKKFDSPETNGPAKYYCEWVGCNGLVFEKFATIYQHIVKNHFEGHADKETLVCMWSGCDGMPRQKWSFMAHVLERHLNEGVLRLWSLKHVDPLTVIPSHAPSTMYPPNAALQAIRRFSARPPFTELLDAKEEMTSKHIHLTAALILRNLARYSCLARSLIKKHESKVALIAFSDTESSCALSSCLYELHHFKN